jgi:hypothetical protein
VADLAGVPLMTGERLPVAADATTILKVGKPTWNPLSRTQMRIFSWVPATIGLPLKRPVLLLKTAQDGRLLMPNDNGLPSGSTAMG